MAIISAKIDGVNYNILKVAVNTTLTGIENVVYLSAGELKLARLRDSIEKVLVKNTSAGPLIVHAYQGVTLTSGTLIIGDTYFMTNWITADNFTNVGGQNVDGTTFVATGATPTVWANSSQVTELVSDKINHATSFVLGAGKTAHIQNSKNQWMVTLVEDNAVEDIAADLANQFEAESELVTPEIGPTIRTAKIWKALLTQTSTGAPSARVLENTLGGTVALARSNAGIYTLTLADAFTVNKTFISKPNQSNVDSAPATHSFTVVKTSKDVVTINSFSGLYTTAADGILLETELLIEVYP